MEQFGKTSAQLTNDLDSLHTDTDAIAATDLTMNTGLRRSGLKDSSGTNGDMFVQDTSLYLKYNNFWYYIPCVSMGTLTQ